MALYGRSRDVSLISSLNRELIKDIIQQEIVYYEFAVNETNANIYNEAVQKFYYEPLYLNCLIDRGDQENPETEFGVDLKQKMKFSFYRLDLIEVNLLPEIGDIVKWEENYYEIHNIVNNQYFVGKNPEYHQTTDTQDFGSSISILCDAHMVRPEKLTLLQTRG
jgi:hypothetical protein